MIKKYGTKISLLIILSVLVVMTGCGQRNESAGTEQIQKEQSDLEYVQSKGTLVVGITDFAPMDYRNGNDWAGFDADLARAFAESLGVTLELKEIDWDKKTEFLEKGSIDCIWNGMTMTEELQESISCSEPYLSNAQVVVLRRNDMERYHTAESCQHLLFAVESGSTGEALLKAKKYRYTAYSTQLEALQSVSKKKSDATVIDVIMASYYTEDGQEFSELGFDISMNDEKICVGLRKDSELTEKVNEFLRSAYEDGTVASLAEQYGIESAVLE